MIYELFKLFYIYDVLELNFDKEIMEIYYIKYYNIYVIKLNEVVVGYFEFVSKFVEELVVNLDSVFEDICGVVCNYGGGYVNYILFWFIFSLNGGGVLIGNLKVVIESEFGIFDEFKEKFNVVVVVCFGFGWVWLVVNDGKLEIVFIVN